MTDLSSIISFYPFPKLIINKTKTELEIFSSNYKNIDHAAIIKVIDKRTECKKDVKLSITLREKGNEEFKESNYQKAFEYYYRSIGAAPLDSFEYGLAVANRSAVLYVNKNYEDCLKDIHNVLDSKYPYHKLGKLYIRRTECYLHLNQNRKAVEAWDVAIDYMEKFKGVVEPPPNIDRLNRKVKEIKENVDLLNSEINEDPSPKSSLKNGENANFLSASNAVEIKVNSKLSRRVVAKTDLEPGDILFVEEPYSAIRNNEPKICCTFCSHCLVLCMANIPCKICPVHFYCSEDCRQQSWNKTHKWECYAERKQLLNSQLRLVLNTLLKASHNNFKTNIENESVYGNKEDNFPFVFNLVTNKKKLSHEELSNCVKSAIIIVVYLKKYTDYFEWLHKQPENVDKPFSALYDVVGSILLKLCMQVNCNDSEIICSSILMYDTPIVDIKFIGLGLYVSSAMINHSCNPNALVTYDKTLQTVRARDKIAKNTEITIDYCKYRSDIITRYDIYLLKKFNFACPCNKCRDPFSLKFEEAPWLCKKCKGKAFHVNNQYVQCVRESCKYIFNIRKYFNKEIKMATDLVNACLRVDCPAIDRVHDQFKRIYHKDNVKFIGFYLSAFEFYNENRLYGKCLEICRCFLQFCEQFSEVNDVKILAHLRLVVALILNYKLMKAEKITLEENALDEINTALDKTKRLLSFFIPPKAIKQYEQNAMKILHEST